jgi:hypothetical protein
MKDTLLEQSTFSAVSRLLIYGSFKSLQILLSAHALQIVLFWLGSVKNEGHITRRTKNLLRCIMPCNLGIFQKINTYYTLRMRYK